VQLFPDPQLALEREVAIKYPGAHGDVEPLGTMRFAATLDVDRVTSPVGSPSVVRVQTARRTGAVVVRAPDRHLGAMPHVDVPAYSGTLAAQLTRPYPSIRRARGRQHSRVSGPKERATQPAIGRAATPAHDPGGASAMLWAWSTCPECRDRRWTA
jgi:hypothetical protein